MVGASHSAIGRVTAAVAVIIVVVVAVGLGAVLTTGGSKSNTSSSTSTTSTTTSSSQTTSSSSTTSSLTSTTTSSSTTTTSSSSTPVGCVFSPPPPIQANTTVFPLPFSGCLTPGATGQYLIAVGDKAGVLLLGSIGAQFPINVTVVPKAIGNLPANGTAAFSANNTTLQGFHNVFLPGSSGWGITIVNAGGQNNTVNLVLRIYDANAYAGQG